ncbi:hypothetical protein [Gloeocapsa sp. PCC 73106]|uniref:hypothetical protein n=1 Tax=Gloeocapsa sp. PCC 73106 TaxID=102232 RepID=UPI0002AC0877|nr:hypothetical protein [Gloeocapsa sp. PCC 73106]ELR98018.1 hypothetical protein GLO73106DRAFT_00018390 [Gloeocapsa sp. PCC 73106]
MKVTLVRFLVATAILGIAVPGHSASLSFRPAGSQLDTDPINDLNFEVGDQFAFTLSVDTTGIANPLQSFTYEISRDNTEILLDSAVITPEADAIFTRTQIQDVVTGSFSVGLINYEANPGQSLAPDTQLDFAIATYTTQPGLVNDGVFDYKLEITEAIDVLGNNVTSAFTPAILEAEVQNIPEPSSILVSLILSSLGAGSFFRKKPI